MLNHLNESSDYQIYVLSFIIVTINREYDLNFDSLLKETT